MILWGKREKKLKEGRLQQVTCPECHSLTSMHYIVFGRYIDVFWIPTFPIGKKKIIECDKCTEQFFLKNLPQPIKAKFKTEVSTRHSIWSFSGLVAIISLISLLIFVVVKDDINDKNYINNPMIGDVYTIKLERKDRYTTMKITEITQDSIIVIYNIESTPRRAKIYSIDKAKNYMEFSKDRFSKQDIKDLYHEKFIYEVDRH
ncbi:zinc-ribbon domain-containing protein [uncultured Psychroserpens sp.]|uniref:zinc-ribbon domain-containing protein n=1 Tax=uncultured Psychroserpens sp. TaxID=255436 RepID=UPI00262FFEE6|nr:zinc-ribbon domain-containing protein [uncultured Psychroserpens sp.]